MVPKRKTLCPELFGHHLGLLLRSPVAYPHDETAHTPLYPAQQE